MVLLILEGFVANSCDISNEDDGAKLAPWLSDCLRPFSVSSIDGGCVGVGSTILPERRFVPFSCGVVIFSSLSRVN